jgi:hypothetical protein
VQHTFCASIMWMLLGSATSAFAATFQTANFLVTADSPTLAKTVAEEAEKCRAMLAKNWLKTPLKNWPNACPIVVSTRDKGANGWTSYEKMGGKTVRVGIQMQGPPDRLLEYVLPHELTHAVLASALGETLPRWADEGAAMLSESESEKIRQTLVARQLIEMGDTIPMRQLLHMASYPASKSRLHAFYAQSLTLTEFLISKGGHAQFLDFVREGREDNWDLALSRHYQWDNIETLQAAWSEWIHDNAQDKIDLPVEHVATRK